MKGDIMFKIKLNLLMAIASLAFMLLPSNNISGQNDKKAEEILEDLRENYEASIKGIEDFVVVAEQHTTYYKKAWDNDRPYFKTKSKLKKEKTGSATNSWSIYSPEKFSEIVNNASYYGMVNIEGHTVHVIHIDNPELMMDEFDDSGYVEDIKDFRLYIDPGDWVIRKVEFNVLIKSDDGVQREGEVQVIENDFRNIEGMMIPYKTEIIYTGLALTDEQRREAEEGLVEMEKELENMPDVQRQTLEQMMGSKIELYRKMIEEDQMVYVNVVKEVKVNTGIKDID
jgi:hypothetical protein